MIPTKKQWSNWSLPSKYAAIGILLGVVTLAVPLISALTNLETLTATEYAKNTQWYLDAKLTAKNMPVELKQFISKNNEDLKSKFQMQVKDAFGVSSDEYKIVSSITNDADSFFQVLLFISRTKLVITDENMEFTQEIDVKEMHNKSIKNNNNCSSSSFEYKDLSGDIIRVTKSGIYFKIPSQNFTEHSGCNTEKIEVSYLPATAYLEGSNLVITHQNGVRIMEGRNGKKTVKRKDAKYYYTLSQKNPYGVLNN